MKIHVYTQAYNAEKTLARAVESVLAQTQGDLTYYLIDNGSTDNTRAIIQAYSERDARIVPVYREANIPAGLFMVLPEYEYMLLQGDYFFMLDADDVYDVRFFDETLRFLQENRLDVAACCSDLIDAQTGQNISRVTLEESIVVSGEGFSGQFADYYRYFGSMWGKLFRSEAIRRIDLNQLRSLHAAADLYANGYDTIFMIEYLKRAERIGVLARSLHQYFIYPAGSSSVSATLQAKVRLCFALDNLLRAFLAQKCGGVSPQNEQYLQQLSYRRLYKTMEAIEATGQETQANKMLLLHQIFDRRHTKELLQQVPQAQAQAFRSMAMAFASGYADPAGLWQELIDAIQGDGK